MATLLLTSPSAPQRHIIIMDGLSLSAGGTSSKLPDLVHIAQQMRMSQVMQGALPTRQQRSMRLSVGAIIAAGSQHYCSNLQPPFLW